MLAMHLYLVCNMNKIGRVFVLYIIVLATTGADYIKSYKTSTTTTKWKEPSTTTRWKQSTTTPKAYSAKKLGTTSFYHPTTSKSVPASIASQASINNGMIAVASFSDTRNGRRSSMEGIKIYPPVDSSMVKTDDKGNFIFNSVHGKMPMPITITKQGDGVSGTIRILPGSVSVSSSSSSSPKSGPATAVASYNPWSTPYMKPMINDIYFPPFPSFPSIPDPMFNQRIPDSFNTRFPDPFSYMRIPEPPMHTRIQDPWMNKNRYKEPQIKHDMYQPSNWYYPSFSPFINYWR